MAGLKHHTCCVPVWKHLTALWPVCSGPESGGQVHEDPGDRVTQPGAVLLSRSGSWTHQLCRCTEDGENLGVLTVKPKLEYQHTCTSCRAMVWACYRMQAGMRSGTSTHCMLDKTEQILTLSLPCSWWIPACCIARSAPAAHPRPPSSPHPPQTPNPPPAPLRQPPTTPHPLP